MSNLLKNLLIVLGLAVIMFVGYVVFIKGEDMDESLLDANSAGSLQAELETQRLLGLLNELKALDIQGEVFTDPIFLSLQDFRKDLGDEPSGRSNPFAPTE